MKLNLEKIAKDLIVIDPKIKSNVNWKALKSSRPDTFYSRVVIVDSSYYGTSSTDRILHHIPLKECDYRIELRFCYPVIASHEYLMCCSPESTTEKLNEYLEGEVSHVFHAMREKKLGPEKFALYLEYRKSMLKKAFKNFVSDTKTSKRELKYLENSIAFFDYLEVKYNT